MATQAEQIAASQMRQKIPTHWLIEFNDWTDDSLLSLSRDVAVLPEIRAFAGWELDYRLAFGVEVEAPELTAEEKQRAETLRVKFAAIAAGANR